MTTTLMDIVIGCENYLGWQPSNAHLPEWKYRSVEIAKLRRAITNGTPTRETTPRNLALALEYSRRKRLSVDSPVALAFRIKEALALAYLPAMPCDVEHRIRGAVQWERDHEETDSLRWIHRLTRSHGPGREEVLVEWQAAGRG